MPSNPDKLTTDEIAAVAAAAGFNKSEDMLTTATAVALAESSGRTKAVSPTGCCHGLWQINTEVHPYTKAQMQDPAQNAAAAFKISESGTRWKPWVAYTTGAYVPFTLQARAAAKKVLAGGGHGTVPGVIVGELADEASTITDIVQFPEMVRQWISDRNNIMRIAKVAIGIALLIGGAIIVMKPAIENAAGSVVGGVVKGAIKK